MATESGQIYLPEMALIVRRTPHTVRRWISSGVLPDDLKPKRQGGRQQIYWEKTQVENMKKFAIDQLEKRGWQHGA